MVLADQLVVLLRISRTSRAYVPWACCSIISRNMAKIRTVIGFPALTLAGIIRGRVLLFGMIYHVGITMHHDPVPITRTIHFFLEANGL